MRLVVMIVAVTFYVPVLYELKPGPDAGYHVFQQSKATTRAIGEQFEMSAIWGDEKCSDSTRVEGLDGLTQKQITGLLGEPERKETFRLGERQDEFHVSLQNHYPLTTASNSEVEVMEWSWSKDHCRLTIWLHSSGGSWTSFENFRFSDESEF